MLNKKTISSTEIVSFTVRMTRDRFFELCVHPVHANFRLTEGIETSIKCSSTSPHLSQGRFNLFSYTDSQDGECEEVHRGSFIFSEYPQGKHETYTNERTGESHRRVDFGVKWD